MEVIVAASACTSQQHLLQTRKAVLVLYDVSSCGHKITLQALPSGTSIKEHPFNVQISYLAYFLPYLVSQAPHMPAKNNACTYTTIQTAANWSSSCGTQSELKRVEERQPARSPRNFALLLRFERVVTQVQRVQLLQATQLLPRTRRHVLQLAAL